MLTANNAERAGDLLRMLTERNRLFGEHLFTPDAWDILLFLHAAREPQSAQAIRDGLDLYEDTAERWIAALEGESLVEREGPSAFRLTDRAARNLDKALTTD